MTGYTFTYHTEAEPIGVFGKNPKGHKAKSGQAEKKALNYSTFGSMMAGRTYSAGGYRYGFMSFEMDDEIKATGNHISWEGFGYDPRLGRRWSVDPLQAKYPWQSPYSAMGNNPILHKELDGRDYAVYVNHETKTIIIKATYYTVAGNENDHNSALAATQFWNDESGKYQYKVGRGKNAQNYDIQFQLDVKQVDNPLYQANIDRVPDEILSDGRAKLTPDMSSNTYAVLPDDDPTFETKENRQTQGRTIGGEVIKIMESRKEAETGPHEVGHTLGFGHLDGTIMSEASNVGRTRNINRTIIGVMLNQAGIGRMKPHSDYTRGTGTGHRQPSIGEEPIDFDKGRVINK